MSSCVLPPGHLTCHKGRTINVWFWLNRCRGKNTGCIATPMREVKFMWVASKLTCLFTNTGLLISGYIPTTRSAFKAIAMYSSNVRTWYLPAKETPAYRHALVTFLLPLDPRRSKTWRCIKTYISLFKSQHSWIHVVMPSNFPDVSIPMLDWYHLFWYPLGYYNGDFTFWQYFCF